MMHNTIQYARLEQNTTKTIAQLKASTVMANNAYGGIYARDLSLKIVLMQFMTDLFVHVQ